MSRKDASIAAVRFGLGAGEGLAGVAADPRGWLIDQLASVDVPRPLRDADGSPERVSALLTAYRRGAGAVVDLLRQAGRDAYRADAAARTLAAVVTPQPFRERLVHFWSNHFTVSSVRRVVLALAGPYEIEAIRPHVTGRFADLLLAVVRHPAMLVYLDNAQSMGPNAPVGRRRGRGLNENLAREILELHTLGVDGGYSQDDVRALAAILTGWTIARPGSPGSGRFAFVPAMHEPGDKTLLGVRYREAGEEEGLAALAALARHPATARHVAVKLARHFVADAPPQAAVARLEGVFRDTDGDLLAVSAALVDIEEAWQPLTKVKAPNDLVVSTARAFALSDAADLGERLVPSLALLGQLPFMAPSPAGWPDDAASWIGPEAVMRRIDWAVEAGRRLARRDDPRALPDRALGPLASAHLRFLVEGAPSTAEGIALLLSSTDFQRR